MSTQMSTRQRFGRRLGRPKPSGSLKISAMKIVVESHLTEQSLKVALHALVGNDWIGPLALPRSRRKFDMAFRSKGMTLLVEYDGDEHYRSSLKIKADREKDLLAVMNDMHLVRVPYWVQLDSTMAMHWFGLEANIEQSFPHGFITTVFFPASFCELGIMRFRRELDSLPAKVLPAVVASLLDRAGEHGIEYVLPSELRSIITT